jgi:hypothetical protein
MPRPPSFLGLVARLQAARGGLLALRLEPLQTQCFIYLSIWSITEGGSLTFPMKKLVELKVLSSPFAVCLLD